MVFILLLHSDLYFRFSLLVYFYYGLDTHYIVVIISHINEGQHLTWRHNYLYLYKKFVTKTFEIVGKTFEFKNIES